MNIYVISIGTIVTAYLAWAVYKNHEQVDALKILISNSTFQTQNLSKELKIIEEQNKRSSKNDSITNAVNVNRLFIFRNKIFELNVDKDVFKNDKASLIFITELKKAIEEELENPVFIENDSLLVQSIDLLNGLNWEVLFFNEDTKNFVPPDGRKKTPVRSLKQKEFKDSTFLEVFKKYDHFNESVNDFVNGLKTFK